ncbi:MAG: hypothetical protein WC997_03440 [Porticoccaceae bacterium]
MDKKHLLLAAVLSIFTTGCAITNQYEVAEYEPLLEHRLPEISVFYLKASDAFYQACEDFNRSSTQKHCEINNIDLRSIKDVFQETELFERVTLADQTADYKLLITSATYTHNTAEDGASAYLAGATLLMAPVSITQTIKLDVSLQWLDLEVERYQLDIPFTRKISLLSLNQDTRLDIAKSVSSHLLQRFQEEDSFSAAVIAGRLESADYGAQLELPERVAPHIKEASHVYHHPLHGAQTRYIHEIFDFEFIDVFVYPIRQTDWRDHRRSLAIEAQNFRDELMAFQREGEINNLMFEQEQYHLWSIGDQDLTVIHVPVTFRDADNVDHNSHCYIFIQQDQFIKIRSSFADTSADAPDLETFTRAIASTIKVPGESPFMAQLRHYWQASAPK